MNFWTGYPDVNRQQFAAQQTFHSLCTSMQESLQLAHCKVLAVYAGRRWGEDSVWLHTEADNVGANALYQAAGYKIHSEGSQAVPGFLTKTLGLGRDRLYWKDLPVRSANGHAEGTSENLYIGGSVRQGDKVFVWNTAESEKS